MNCPKHHTTLVPEETPRGTRFKCTEIGCTVICWDGPTSTPADATTRRARKEAHKAFDALWQGAGRGGRRRAYAWLRKALGIPEAKCHMGMFDETTCDKVIGLAYHAPSMRKKSGRW